MTVAPRADYSGPFDPDFALADLSRSALAVLGREYLLHGQLQDRGAMAPVLGRTGIDARVGLAIDEWMSASPIYSKRMQRALDFTGNDVRTLFKNLQLDIGFSHGYMDVRYELHDERSGEFWLATCGALLDVEPFGEDMVHGMCHDIEDPTFDATAAATNPLIRIRPVHRPPRVPADQQPHCRWRVFFDDAPNATPFAEHPNVEAMRRSRLADVDIVDPGTDRESGGMPDYAGEFDPDFSLESFSHRTLVLADQEFAVQSHLLCRSFLLAVAQRLGNDDEAREIATIQWVGAAGLTAERLRAAMAVEGDDAGAVAKLFQLHPCFQPRTYVDLRVEVLDDQRAVISFRECPAFEEGDPYSWFAQLGRAPHPALDAIARVGNPRARCHPVEAAGDARLTWEMVIDPTADPAPEPNEVRMAKGSNGAALLLAPRTRQRLPLQRAATTTAR
ncbi:MAG: hypothetical protein H0V95_10625 [Actinobacteria bacterium]|nr:hypothetical protein [Actinomycetota bacterium]